MKNSSRCSHEKSFCKKLTAFLVSVCMAAAFAPAAAAEALPDDNQTTEAVVQTTQAAESTTLAAESTTQATESTTQATESTTQATESTTQATESTTQATESTTQATEATTQATESTTQATEATTQSTQNSYSQTSEVRDGDGFGMAQSDGGVLFIGTAHIPRADNSVATVKFVYSSSLNLNDKSLALINKELTACGVTIPGGMIYVSGSDIVSDSQLMTTTSDRKAVFAVGSPENPTVLKAYPAYGSVEESFEMLYRGNIFSISGYSSLRSVLEGRDEVTLSEDGQTASISIVMSEDYVEKVIHGRKIKILMINSELTYYFRAPKMTFVKDQDYNASDSDIVYHYPTHATTDPADTLTTEATRSTTAATEDPFSDDNPTEPTRQTTDTTADKDTQPATDSTTEGTEDFWDDDTTQATKPTKATTPSSDNDDTDSTTENTSPTHATEPSRLIPKAQPINPIPTQSTIDDYPTQTLPTETAPTASRTEPTTDSTTERTEKPTRDITLPTATQPTRSEEPVIDPFNPREQQEVGEAFVNTRRLPLNIRSGPGLNYMVVNLLPKGTHLTVLDTSNPDWYMVRTKNRTVGYAYSYYIKFVE